MREIKWTGYAKKPEGSPAAVIMAATLVFCSLARHNASRLSPVTQVTRIR
jgi:hypothetical protein